MKNIKIIISLIFVFILLVGCGARKSSEELDSNHPVDNPKESEVPKEDNIAKPTPVVTDQLPSESENKTNIDSYYPFAENTQYIYEGEGNEYASYTLYTDYVDGNFAQIRSNNGGTEMVKVFEKKEGILTMNLIKEEAYYRENLMNHRDDEEEIILKEPLVKGTEWILADKRKRYISNTNVKITTPVGVYDALEVTTEGKDDKIIDYYASGVGLIKSVFVSNESEITSILSEIKKDTPFIQSIQLFYPNIDEDVIYSLNKEIPFYTNDITKTKIEQAIKEITGEKYNKVLSPNTKIKSLYLNKDQVVYADFTKELVSEMGAGSGYEGLILQCITNTLGNYYGVGEVYITIEGKPYESGHYIMEKGETFTVDMSNVKE